LKLEPAISISRCDFSVCRSRSSSAKRRSPFFDLVSDLHRQLLIVRRSLPAHNDLLSRVISPAAVMAKLMFRSEPPQWSAVPRPLGFATLLLANAKFLRPLLAGKIAAYAKRGENEGQGQWNLH
jgi:hypothetical protein